MDSASLEATLKSVESCISGAKWRLKPSSRRRLQTDILALCTGLRAVVLVDYGGKMPELQERLCALVRLLHLESTVLLPLRVMVIEDMVYLVHVKGLTELASLSLRSDHKLLLVDLEHDPLKMLLHAEQNTLTSDLLSIQKLFSSLFPVDVDIDLLPVMPPPVAVANSEPSESKDTDLVLFGDNNALQSSEIIDLTRILNDIEVTTPTLNGKAQPSARGSCCCSHLIKKKVTQCTRLPPLRCIGEGQTCALLPWHAGRLFPDSNPCRCEWVTLLLLLWWLLGYPVVYLFRKEKAADAIYNLSTQCLNIYKIIICRNQTDSRNPLEEELMSFTVPCDLSIRQEKEPWAEAFYAHMKVKLEGCRQVWSSLRLEIIECLPQAIVL